MSRSQEKRNGRRSLVMGRRQMWRDRGWRPIPECAPDDLPPRPTTRGECPETRPCPWVSCRYHLYLDVHPRFGSLQINFPDLEPWELAETCALDVAEQMRQRLRVDADGQPAILDSEGLPGTLDDVGEFMNITRERARQIEERALKSLRLKLAGGTDESS